MEEKIQQATKIMNTLSAEIIKESEYYSSVNYLASELECWEEKFDNADDNQKRAMLYKIVNKVYLGKGEIQIEFNWVLNECMVNMK